MSAHSSGFVRIPNSIIEHLHLLTRAETALTLCVLRRASGAGARGAGVAVTDANWSRWTGLAARQKIYAIAGLRQKGLSLNGKGDSAKYAFDETAFVRYVKANSAESCEVRTVGRKKSVAAPEGMKVHPECRQGGCQMLCGGAEHSCEVATAVTSAASSVRIVDVVQSLPPSHPRVVAVAGVRCYPLSIEKLAELGYPLAGDVFISSLLAKCEGQVDDRILATAIDLASKIKGRSQRGEGLFLLTVPPLLDKARLIVLTSESSSLIPIPSFCDRLALLVGETGLVSEWRELLASADLGTEVGFEKVYDATQALRKRLLPVAFEKSEWEPFLQARGLSLSAKDSEVLPLVLVFLGLDTYA